MSFMAIMDFVSSEHSDVSNYLSLRVSKDGGIETVPDMDISITKLNKNGVNRFNHFFSNGFGGITFKVKVLIKYHVHREDGSKNKSYQKDEIIDVVKNEDKGEPYVHELTDMWNDKPVLDVLHNWFINMTPLSVVTDAVDVPNGRYIISSNPARKQDYKNSTIWELEFTTYTPLTLYKWENNNKNTLKALKKNKSKKIKNVKLSKCNYKTLVYSKKKKSVKCVKYLQKVLKKQKCYNGKIDGWFGKDTTKAVKKFQNKYNNKHVKLKGVSDVLKNKKNAKISITGLNKALSENGKVNKDTFKALCYA